MGPRTVSDKRLKGVREDLNGVCQACTELSEAFVVCLYCVGKVVQSDCKAFANACEAFVLRLNSVGEACETRLGSVA